MLWRDPLFNAFTTPDINKTHSHTRTYIHRHDQLVVKNRQSSILSLDIVRCLVRITVRISLLPYLLRVAYYLTDLTGVRLSDY